MVDGERELQIYLLRVEGIDSTNLRADYLTSSMRFL